MRYRHANSASTTFKVSLGATIMLGSVAVDAHLSTLRCCATQNVAASPEEFAKLSGASLLQQRSSLVTTYRACAGTA